ncbi:MAG: hypothetical protein AB2L18_12340 [Anaerolineaceae bacterium]
MSKLHAAEYTLRDFHENVAAEHNIPPKKAAFVDFPEYLPLELIDFFNAQGIRNLY